MYRKGSAVLKKILIVDDSKLYRNMVKLLLEKSNCEVVGEAEDGIAAVEKYKALQPDFVTMDIEMPGMDGIQALEAIKKIDPAAAVIMLTSNDSSELIRKSSFLGAKAYLLKSFPKSRIVDTIIQLEGGKE